MPYEPKDWADGPEGLTPLNAAELERMETQYGEAVKDSADAADGKYEPVGLSEETQTALAAAFEPVGLSEETQAALSAIYEPAGLSEETQTALNAAIARLAAPRRTASVLANMFENMNPMPSHPNDSVLPIGVGAGGAVYYITGVAVTATSKLRRTTDRGATSIEVGSPAGTYASTCSELLEWNGFVYGVFMDNSDSRYRIYRAPVTTGSTVLTWSAALATLTAGVDAFACELTATSTALLVGEYGDPKVSAANSAHIWRTTDGTSFTIAKTYPATVRHVHCVAADPFNDGEVWASFGDNVNNCFSWSPDHGATWTDLPITKEWQAVQISFTADWVFCAPDAVANAPAFVIDRATKTPRVAAFEDHRSLKILEPGVYRNGKTTLGSPTLEFAAPGYYGPLLPADVGRKVYGPGIPPNTTIIAVVSSGNATMSANATASASGIQVTIERYEIPLPLAFMGQVDPVTGIYYGFANSDLSSFTPGIAKRYMLFMIPYVGGPVVHLNDLTRSSRRIFFDTLGNLWVGDGYRKRIITPYAQ